LSIRTREDTQGRVRWEARSGQLEAALRHALEGDVRADPYTRHLYAADASMYAVERPAMPAPTMQTSAVTFLRSSRNSGTSAVPCQIDAV